MPGKKIWDVVVVGEFFLDIILSGFQSLPKLGEESFARYHKKEAGGGAAITACGLAKLGAHVSVLGVAGGEDGDWVLQRMQSHGVDTEAVLRNPTESTGVTVSVSTREDRAFLSYYGANHLLAQNLRNPKWITRMSQGRHVHFACAPDADLDAELFPALKKAGCRISIDVQSHVSWLTRAKNLHMLRGADVFFPNEREAEWLSGVTSVPGILIKLRDMGLRGVGLKLGGKGAALYWKKHEYFCDPLPVEVVDSTGAGDSFNAGFIYAWLHHEDPQHCLEIANICGALSTRALGGISAFPTPEEVAEAERSST